MAEWDKQKEGKKTQTLDLVPAKENNSKLNLLSLKY